MNAAIVGYGTVGKALAKCYKKSKLPVVLKDKASKQIKNIDFLNICFPYSNRFVSTTINYIKKIKPQYVIIHSTVPCGTADIIKEKTKVPIISSPVRGSHDNLYRGIKTFVKYIGCTDMHAAICVQKHFKKLKIKSKILPSNKTVELAKLLCTTYYGLCIKWHELILNAASKAGVNYHDIIDWNNSYNEGYSKLDQKHFIRPVLYPPKGKIGGTCILPNIRLLKSLYSHSILDAILE